MNVCYGRSEGLQGIHAGCLGLGSRRGLCFFFLSGFSTVRMLGFQLLVSEGSGCRVLAVFGTSQPGLHPLVFEDSLPTVAVPHFRDPSHKDLSRPLDYGSE